MDQTQEEEKVTPPNSFWILDFGFWIAEGWRAVVCRLPRRHSKIHNHQFHNSNPQSKIQNPKSKISASGSALIVVLWVVGLLSMFVIAFAFDMHIQSRITSSWRKSLKADYLVRAGMALADMVLLETADPDINNTDTTAYFSKGADTQIRQAAWTLARGGSVELTRELGAGSVTLSIRPENARINLNSLIHVEDRTLTYQAWETLFENLGIPQDARDILVDCLLDWVDMDELSHLNGVESEYYERLPNPYKAKNKPIDTVDELALIKGFDELIPDTTQTIYEAVAKYLTTYAEDQKININAADVSTLMASLNIDEMLAEYIVLARIGPDGIAGTEDDEPFKDLADLMARVPGLNQSIAGQITFSAMGLFTVRSRGTVGNMSRTATCVMRLADNKLSILNWIEGETP